MAPAIAALDLLAGLVRAMEAETYESFERRTRQRIGRRDEDDWPILAVALALESPIWTCLLYTSPSPRDRQKSRMPSSA